MTELRRAVLTGVATYLPERLLTNADLAADSVDWDEERIQETLGIDHRHVAAPGEFTSHMAVKACEELFARDPAHREGIDFVLLTTVTPDYLLPFTAALVQRELGLPKDVGAVDLTLGCSGYVYAASMAASLVESGRARKVLVVTGDRFTDYTERAAHDLRILFGDGATASLVQRAEEGVTGGVVGASAFGTDGKGEEKLVVPTSAARGWSDPGAGPPVIHMDGNAVFTFTTRTVLPHLKAFLAANELAPGDVDLYVFHQPNKFMLTHLQHRLGLEDRQVVLRVADVGNTVSSTIPLALETAFAEERVRAGSTVLLCGFGVGYSWGSVLLRWSE